MRSLAVLSMHTCPLAAPGSGDGGGMNVYVRELASALARVDVQVDVYTRAERPDVAAVVDVEPGFRVHHVPVGPLARVDKHALPALVPDFADAVAARMSAGHPADAIHANYWLSAVAGHELKHRLDLPLVCTFHTLDRVKAEADVSDDASLRAAEELRAIGCSDAVLASCDAEVDQLVRLYDAEPARIEVVPPGVDHAFFAPGDRRQARRAIGLPDASPLLLFVGRIQPLKGADVAVRAFARLAAAHPGALLAVVGGPSGPEGPAEAQRLRDLVSELGVAERVRFVEPQPHELLSTWYRAASVVLVPSRAESFGLVALEAAACGTPVVAADVGGLSSLVDHGRTGFLVDGRDPARYAAAASAVLADPALADRLGAAAAERAGGYTWRSAARTMRSLYERLTARELVRCP